MQYNQNRINCFQFCFIFRKKSNLFSWIYSWGFQKSAMLKSSNRSAWFIFRVQLSCKYWFVFLKHFSLVHNFLPNPGRILPALTFIECQCWQDSVEKLDDVFCWSRYLVWRGVPWCSRETLRYKWTVTRWEVVGSLTSSLFIYHWTLSVNKAAYHKYRFTK